MSSLDGGAAGRRHDACDDQDPDFQTVYRAEAGGLLRYFRRRLANNEDAEDLTQETLARYLRAAPATRIETPQAYLRTIANNLLRDRTDRNSTKLARLSEPIEAGFDQTSGLDPHRELVAKQELDHYRAVLSTLKPLTLKIFLMHRVDGHTHQQISELLGMNIWAVKRQMVKAIAHIDRHRRRP